jgi:DNA-binding FadR family transcriptional regulator
MTEPIHAVTRAIAIFQLLKEAAAHCEPAPTVPALAKQFGCSKKLIRNGLHLLESTAMIERGGGKVTIRATGETTAAHPRKASR